MKAPTVIAVGLGALLLACARPLPEANETRPVVHPNSETIPVSVPYDLTALHPRVREAVERARAAAAGAETNRGTGLTVQVWSNGDRFSGQYSDGEKQGFGVYQFADGRRYEGAYLNDLPHGWGVDWAENGEVARQGRFDRRRLVERVEGAGAAP